MVILFGLARRTARKSRKYDDYHAAERISKALPMTIVGKPLSSIARATRLAVWWQSGHIGTTRTASTPSAAIASTTAGASFCCTVRVE